jgi:uncharacterized protein (DUF1697 family)
VALLRGINVGRNNRVAMADLRALLGDLGYTDVRTHLNSGNAVFTVPGRTSARSVEKAVEEGLTRLTGRTIRVVVRTRDELAGVVDANPFVDVVEDGSRLLVTFFGGRPPASTLEGLDPDAFLPERFALVGRELYAWLPGGMQNSALLKALDGRPADLVATGRNWNTVTRLLELADG